MATQLKSAENEYGIKAEYGHYIGGEWIAGDSGKTIDLFNPSTGKVGASNNPLDISGLICWGGRPPNGIEVCQNEVVADLN